MKHTVKAALFALAAAVVGLTSPATAAPVTKTGTVPCTGIGPSGGCAVDSYEVRCTSRAQRLSIQLTSSGSRPYMTAVVKEPETMKGWAVRAWGEPGVAREKIFYTWNWGEKVRALVVVMGQDIPGHDLPYQLKASCYSFVSNADGEGSDDDVVYLDDDPDPDNPDDPDDQTPNGDYTKVLKGTAIIKKQDQ
jgi:hypothetical protein